MTRSPGALPDLERRIGNTVAYGRIEAVDYAKARARVRTGDNVTAWIPWGTGRAGGDRTWHPPEVGEQVLVASPCGDLAQGCIVTTVNQSAHPAPGDKATVSRTVYADGAVVEYDRDSHGYRIDLPAAGTATVHVGDATVEAKTDGIALTCGGSSLRITPAGIFLSGPTVGMTAGGGSGAATLAGNFQMVGQLAVTGNVSATGDMLNAGQNSNHHSH
ncbi:phage baseplate assembly protein V [Azospirillum doebereinerae]|uniref:phage baseplate assembly protein V n=1 Tax=Azospirillum doebereinerae TaxID=92933 RepID=UPI001EE5E695|nr:phage baseplate assembly protein V [Azospirillum doebereinerae]MCG5240093.1 phage baseplate assembly protein V [Azospirillum doebereinerae]